MTITSRDLVLSVLEELPAHGAYAILHGVDRLLAGDLGSDVDLVTDRPARAYMQALLPGLARKGVRPVLVLPYDFGAVSFILRDKSGSTAQFDFMYDTAGRGRYGIKSGALLASARSVDGLFAVSAVDERLYLIRKRQRKADSEQLDGILRQIWSLSGTHVGSPDLHGRIDAIFVPRARRAVHSALQGSRATDAVTAAEAAVRVALRPSKILRPAGLVVDVRGTRDEVIREMANRLRERLPRVWVRRHVSLIDAMHARSTSSVVIGDCSALPRVIPRAVAASDNSEALEGLVWQSLERAALGWIAESTHAPGP